MKKMNSDSLYRACWNDCNTHLIISSIKGTREFLAKHLGNKYEDGSISRLQDEERKIPGGSIFSKAGPHNKPLEFKSEIKNQPWPTIPSFTKERREELEVQNESIASWEDHYAKYQTLSEEWKRALSFKDFCESNTKPMQEGEIEFPPKISSWGMLLVISLYHTLMVHQIALLVHGSKI